MKIKRSYVWTGVIVAALIALWAVQQEGGSVKKIIDNLTLNSPSGTSTPTPTPSAQGGTRVSTGTKTVNPTPTGTPFNSLPYTQLREQYMGRRVQFDQYCQASPSVMSQKNGTTIMLDNRSGDARKVAIAGITYSIPGYGWAFATLRSSVLPKTYTINCGSAVNVGSVTIQ